MKNLILTFLVVLPTIAFGQIALTTAQIAKRVSPSIVVIQGRTASGDLLGSGFIVSKDGKIVTNLHVIRDMKSVSVQTASGEIFDSISVLATDERRDLAVLKIAGFDLPTLDLGNSDAVAVGEPLVIVGSPRGFEGTVTAGILSSVRNTGDGYKVLQTDAAVNPGNSGGPLVNNKAQVIGVVSFTLRSAEALNFAVPINYLRGLLDNLHEPITLDQMRAALSPATRSQDDTGPSLKETLDWLKQTIPLGVVNFSYSFDGYTHAQTYQSKAWDLDSCTVTVGEEMITSSMQYPTQQPAVMTFRHTVPLGILVGGTVERHDTILWSNAKLIGGDRWDYKVTLRGTSKEVLSHVFGNSLERPLSSENLDHFELDFSDESLAQRVLTAFRHAADLCRNKEVF